MADVRQFLRRVLAVCVSGVAVAGCFAPQPPDFGDGESMPEEVFRVPVPVRPGADGTWALRDADLLGEGRTVVRLGADGSMLWRLRLPDDLALTSRTPGDPHSALSPSVLVGGRPGRSGPASVAGLDVERGTLTWRQALPAGSRVFLYGGVVVTAVCAGSESCRLTGLQDRSGQRLWSRTVPGRVLDGCRADALGGEPAERCLPHVVTPSRVGAVDPENGLLHWAEGVRLPAGAVVDRIALAGERTVLVTAPAEGTCRSLAVGGSTYYDRGWRTAFVWDQPQARRDPRTGCRWDRRLPLVVGHMLALPDARGARVMEPSLGPLRRTHRLAPGEYLLGNGFPREIVRAAGRPDRLLFPSTIPAYDRPRPKGLGPAAQHVTGDFWQDGTRLALLSYDGRVRWETRSACRARPTAVKAGPVTYCDGTELVRLGPA
ncbi:PQQ-binding-like beta-propeller repeat protein [Streptomyces sp. NPDC096205]|uniref:outer membrane protein assembly factor BamB family protein n=1 Tax=Streptomyces sp. NPDC096205 TaxID=3366081 RepID=UPI0038009629